MSRFARSIAVAWLCGAAFLAAADNLSLQQTDGKLLTVIDDGTAGAYQQQLERRNPDGSLDPRFGRGGRVAFTLGAESLGPRALRLDPRGRVLVIGAAFGADDRVAPATARFLPDGRPDASWGVQGRSLAPSPGEDALGVDVLGMGDDSVLLLGQVESRAGDQVALWRLRGDGSVDPGFGRGGVWLAKGLDGAQALGLQGGDDGAALIAVQVPAQGTNWLEVHRWQPGLAELQLVARQPAPPAWRGPATLDRRNGNLQWFDANGGVGLPLAAKNADGADGGGASSSQPSLGNAGFNPFAVESVPSTSEIDVPDDSLQWLGWSGALLAAVLAFAWWLRRRHATIDLGMLDTRSARSAQIEAAMRRMKAAPQRQMGLVPPAEGGGLGAAYGVGGPVAPSPTGVGVAEVSRPRPMSDQSVAAIQKPDAAPGFATATFAVPADQPVVPKAPMAGRVAPSAAGGRAGCRNSLPRPQFGEPDDLKRIKGVGPKLERLLNGEGVYYFWQIAAWAREDVAHVDSRMISFKGRIERDDWVGQASELACLPDAAPKPLGAA